MSTARRAPRDVPQIAGTAGLERIPDFLAELRAIPKRETQRIWGRCLAEIKHLKTGKWYPTRGSILEKRGIPDEHGRLYVLGYDATALRSVLRNYRNAVRRELGDKHPSLKYLKPSAKTQIDVKEAQDERIYAMHHHLRPISCEDLVDVADGLIASPEAHRPLVIAAALLLLTGRRPWEILETGSFQRVKRSDDRLIFAGQAKRVKAGYDTPPAKPYEIPVLADAGRIVDALKYVRKHYSLDDLRERAESADEFYSLAHSRYSKTLGQYAKRYFRDENDGSLLPGNKRYDGGISPSDLRAAYATIAFEWFAPEDVSLNAYFSRILGHSEFDFVTSLSYCTFYPIGEKRDFVRDFRRGTKDAIDAQKTLLQTKTDEKERFYIQQRIEKFARVLAE